MGYAFFSIPVRDDGRSAALLNEFLKSHRVLHVDRQWIANGENSCWNFCVDYWDPQDASSASRSGRTKERVDYKEVLPPNEFAIFAALRDWRRQLAKQESVPPYTIFDNEQLAQMVQAKPTSKESLAAIPGVGAARIDKYGEAVLAVLSNAWKGLDAPRE